MIANSRCREKFHAALRLLAVGQGDVRSRLREAYRYLRMLRKEDVPDSLRVEWNAILVALTRHGPEVGSDGKSYGTAVIHTMARIRNSTGSVIAQRIYSLVNSID